MRLTQEIATAAARDAGNRSMRAAGRTRWNRADYKAACWELNRLLDKLDELKGRRGE